MSLEVSRAIFDGDVEKFDTFVRQGLDVNEITEKESWNYLHRALISPAMPPTLEMIQHLIGYGIDVNAVDVYGNTPLHYAARLKNAQLIRALLNANAKVNHVNKDGVSPLREMLLVKPFDYDSISLLLESGADAGQKSGKGISVRDYAKIVAYEDTALIDLFNKYTT